MAGTLKVDSINADSNLALKIANTAVAFIDSTGLKMSGSNLQFSGGGTLTVAANSAIINPTITTPTITSPSISDNLLFTSSSGSTIRWQNGYQTITGDAGTDVLTYRTYSTHIWKTLTSAGSNTDGTERMRVNGNGIGLSGAVPSSGVGITFPGTQSASSDANTLDDYEEGTWTPTISSTGGSITTYTASGTYTKIGRLVHFTLKVNLTTVGSASGNMVVANFPFACGATNIQSTYIVREGALTGQCYQFYLNSGGTDGILQSLTGTAAGWTNSYAYYGTGTYISA